MNRRRPPLSIRVVARLLRGRMADEFVQELEEGFHEHRASRGSAPARLWLLRQIVRWDTLRLVRALRARERGGPRRRTDSIPEGRDRPATFAFAAPRGTLGSIGTGAARHLRHASRGLARRPGFTLSIVATLALGIGANTAVFSVIDGILLEPLPFPEPHRLVYVWGRTADDETALLSGPQAAEVLSADVFPSAAQVFGFGSTSMTRGELPEPIRTLTVGHTFFDVMGVPPLLGRTFGPDDEFKLTNQQIRDPDFERPIGATVLSYAYWQQAFAGDVDALGRMIRISGHRHEIVGVMPPEFRAHLPSELAETTPEDMWIMSPFDQPSFPRDTRFVRVIGRVPDHVGLEVAQAELDRLSSWQRATFAEDARDDFRLRATWLQDEAGSTARAPLSILLTAVGFVLLIACANVATLLLVRASEREQELRLRRALGAGPVELTAFGLAESMVAALAGGTLGVALAPTLTSALLRLAPADLPRLDSVEVDGSVLAFTAILTLLVAVVAGALPAWRSLRAVAPDSGSRLTASVRQRWTGNVLVSVEVALAVVLVTGTGLLLRSLGNVFAVDPGFDPRGVHTWEANLTTPTHPTWESRLAYFEGVQEALLAEPGVQATGIMTPVPFAGADRGEIRLGMDDDARRIVADYRRTGPGALEALGVELVEGRLLEWRDLESFDRLHAVVDERFAEQAWPGERAVGKIISVVRREYGEASRVWDEWKRVEVVGVVTPIRGRDVRSEDLPTAYFTYSQNMWGRPAFVARSATPLTTRQVRNAAGAADPRPLLTDLRSLEDVADARLGPLHFALTLIGAFGALGVTLAATGVYGLLAYSVGSRERELNIRAALGADAPTLAAEVIRSGLGVTGAGVLAGWLGSWALTRFIRSLLFGVSPGDPMTFLAVAGFLALVAIVASWVPARRARHRNPVEALR